MDFDDDNTKALPGPESLTIEQCFDELESRHAKQTTTWTNKTNAIIAMTINVRGMEIDRGGNVHRAKSLPIELAPGESVTLPRIFDKAIQDIRNGMIVGGLGPQLTRTGDGDRVAKVHPALLSTTDYVRSVLDSGRRLEDAPRSDVTLEVRLLAKARAAKAVSQ